MASQSLSSMRYVDIEGRIIHYKCFYEHGEYGIFSWTEFYEGTASVTRKKYLLFGEEITTEEPKLIFTIYEDCDCPRKSRGWWREKIMKELELLNRADELSRGELI